MKRNFHNKLLLIIMLLTVYILSPVSSVISQVETSTFIQYASISHSPSDTAPLFKKYPGYEYERPAKGKFLVATNQLKDSVFAEAVILVIEHTPFGTMGLIINQPAETKLPEIKESQKKTNGFYFGGPVYGTQTMMLVQSDSKPEESELVFDGVYVSNSKTLLARMTYMPRKNERYRAYVGYAGWRPGQLESEIVRGSWHVLEADPEIIFDKEPHKVWKKLMRLKLSI
jgi:putative transcriptional regulator